MKYIKTYQNNAAYEADKPTMLAPHVGYIEDTDEVKYINDMADLYDIYGTLTGAGATATISFNEKTYTLTPSGDDNWFGLVYSSPISYFAIPNQTSNKRAFKTLKLDLDLTGANSWSNMFGSLENLTTLDLRMFKANPSGSINNIFASNPRLESLFLSDSFNTSGVTNMSRTFYGCNNLNNLDVSNFNTSAVTNMQYMFQSCSALTSLDVSNWNTSAVTNMYQMFNGCSSLTSLDVSNWNTSADTNMYLMFQNCKGLTQLDLSSFNTSGVTDMGGMFQSCSALTSLDVSNWNTSAVSSSTRMFSRCTSLSTVTMNNTNTTTFDMIKAQLVADGRTSCQIIRDGLTWTYNGSEWVSQ